MSLADSIRFVSGLLGRGYDRNESGAAIDEMLAEADGALDRSAIRRALRELERRGEVVVSGRGVKGSPKRYRVQQKDSGLSSGLSERTESRRCSDPPQRRGCRLPAATRSQPEKPIALDRLDGLVALASESARMVVVACLRLTPFLRSDRTVQRGSRKSLPKLR